MEAKVPFDLLAKFITGQGTPEENNKAGEWIEQSPENRGIYVQLEKIWVKAQKEQPDFTPDMEKALEIVNAKLNTDHQPEVSPSANHKNITGFLIRVAAVLLLIAGGWLIVNQIQRRNLIQYTNDTGKPVEIRLPDGSLVTLNTGAVMNYPHVFQKKTREVQLTGEAYFSVLKNPKGPFVIKTENSFIRVLGTSFNVRALKNEDRVIVTVEEGRVEFGYALEQKKAKVEITAGETGLLEKGNKLSRVSTRDNNYLAWKTGTLTFIKTPLMEVIHAVERYFFIKIKSENSALDSVSVDVTLYRDNEAEMIRTIEMLIGYKIIPKDSLYIITTEPI